MTTIDPQNPRYGSVDSFAEIIRDTLAAVSVAYRLDHIDSVTTGILRSLISGPGTDSEVRTWFRNALDAGDLVRAELVPKGKPQPEHDEEVPCALTTHHRTHRWVQLPGRWRTCPGVRTTSPKLEQPGGDAR
ncbi:MAG TPA: hypothetical protein VFX60_19185 [Micromonospora sp.]|nr:hypothetical protein [Micromonospora sp.]